MAQGSQNPWKDEWLTILLVFHFVLVLGDTDDNWMVSRHHINDADWYQYTLGVL